MNIISLITDFGLKDNFVGVMKAVILKVNPQAKIIDICHEIKPQDITEAAFLLKSSFRYFPEGSVHLAVVDPGVGSERKIVIVKTRNYFFVAPDNGILSPTLENEPPIELIDVTNKTYFLKPISSTFHGRDIFAPIAAYLSRGKSIRSFGRKIESFKRLELPRIKMDSENLVGEIIYIDRFGNLISNIDKDNLFNFIKGKRFKICIKNKAIEKISRSYFEGASLKPLALVGSSNYLEIALNSGSARDKLRVSKGDKIIIRRR